MPLDRDDAKRLVGAYVHEYDHQRLHSAIDYVAPADRLAGKVPEILADRERKLDAARKLRAERLSCVAAGNRVTMLLNLLPKNCSSS